MADVRINIIVTAKGLKQLGAVGKQLSALGKRADRIGKTFARVGENLTGVGTAVSSVALPLALLGGISIKIANQFNRSFLEIENLVGIAAKEVSEMKERVLELSGETSKRPRELADALFAVTSAGARGAEALDILERAAKASAIGLGDTRSIALAVTAATTAYGSEVLSAAAATDVLVNTVKFGNLEASELASTLGRVTPIASQVGLSFQDTGAFIATFTRLGGDAAEATTALRGILGSLAKPGTDAAKALAEMGLSAEGLRRTIQEDGIAQALQQVIEGADGNVEALARVIPNVRALTGVLATAGSQGESFAEIQREIRDGLGVTSEGFENFAKSSVFSFDQFIAKAESAAIRLGDALAPALADVLDAAEPVFDVIIDLAKGFSELDESTQKTAVALTLAAVAAGPILFILGQMATGIGKVLQLSGSLASGLGKLSSGLSTTAGTAASSASAITALSVAAVAASAVISVQGTRALAGYGDELRGLDDPIRDAVKQQGFLAQAVAVLPEVLGLAKSAFFGFIEVIKGLPIIGDLIRIQFAALKLVFDGLKGVFDELAKGLSIISDAATSFFERFVTAEGSAEAAQQAFIISQQQLIRASEISGREITDQAEATDILTAEIARLRAETEATTGPILAIAEAEDAAAEAAKRTAAARAAAAAATEKARKANEKYLESVVDLAGRLGFQALNEELKLSEDALLAVGGAGKVSASGLESLRGVIDQARQDGVKLEGELLLVARALNLLDIRAASLEFDFEPPTLSAEELDAAIREVGETFDELRDEAVPGLDDIDDSIGGLKDEALDFGQAVADLANIMQAFGISADSAIGIAVAALQQLGNQLPGIIKDLREGTVLGGTIGRRDIRGTATGIAAGVAGISAATARGGAGRAAAGGALAGAAAGAQVGGPIGAAVGAAVGGIIGFFRGRGRDKVRKAIKESIGVDVSEDLALAIQQAAKDAGRDIQTQSLLSLGDIISTEGFDAFEGGIRGASEAVIMLLAGIADGSIPAKEGIAEVGEAFSLMAVETLEAGRIADAALLDIVAAAKASGEKIPEIAAFIKESLESAAAGIGAIIGAAFEVDGEKLFGGIAVATAQQAQDQATIFAAGFFSTLEEQGLLAAVDAFAPAFDALKEKLADFSDVDFGGVGRFFEIAGDPQFRPLLEGVQGLNDALVGLANSGFLTTESFSAFQRQAGVAFEQLQTAGLSSTEALQQLAPTLQSAIDASERFGIPLDENTQKLIAQAEASGIAFETDPLNRMADVLGLIAELLGATDEQLSALGGTVESIGTAGETAGKQFEEGFKETASVGEDVIDGLSETREEAAAAGAQIGQALAAPLAENVVPAFENVGSKIAELPGEASAAAIQITDAFAESTDLITEDLTNIADAFDPVTESANIAAEAAARIGDAARDAAAASREIRFPGGFIGPGFSAQGGFRGTLPKDTIIQAHRGEFVNIVPAAETRRMNFVSAQNGFGPQEAPTSGRTISLNIGEITVVAPPGADPRRFGVDMIRSIRDDPNVPREIKAIF